MLSASDWKAAFRHWPNTNHWLPSIVDPFILEIRAPPPCLSTLARQRIAKSLGFIDGPRGQKGAATAVSRLLINGPLWAVFSSRFLRVADAVSRFPFPPPTRPIPVYPFSRTSTAPVAGARSSGSKISRPSTIDDLFPISSPVSLRFPSNPTVSRLELETGWRIRGYVNGSRSNFDRRPGVEARRAPLRRSPSTFLCWKLMPKRVDARGSLRIIRIGDSARHNRIR